jgi:hypothetical protein
VPDGLRKSTPPEAEASGRAVSAGAIVVMVNLGFDLSKQRLPEQTRATSDAPGRGMVSSAVYSGESHVLFVAFGRWIATASCSKAVCDYFCSR